jgi:RNA polymerase sigma factor (TIGR02999 family)
MQESASGTDIELGKFCVPPLVSLLNLLSQPISRGVFVNISAPRDVTAYVRQLGLGDSAAGASVTPILYEELRRLARGYLRNERPGHTLQPTALVHEAYLRLVQQKDVEWQDRSHFFGIAARLMRQILVSHAKAHQTGKRGGGAPKLTLEAAEFIPHESADDLVVLDEVLKEFARSYPRQSDVVEFKFFGGMESKEIAVALNVSEKTVLRDWSFAKLWLFRQLHREK